ncbi:MAG TPA: 16S rRNA (guanine(527)-N(7))-methyltransferase RsmG [Solirubrobacteraceae bacterium]|nr:16S rRNA (guanine(527)-N(7))-methyltransferase RsmG [Solirubrobacteraceae bacterium]
MTDDALLATLKGFAGGLDASQLAQLACLLELLEIDEHAPTAVRAAGEAADVHLADSLVALELEPVREARMIADVGSGAGFPGLVLAVALPEARVSLLDSQRRKCQFIERARTRAGITNARAVCTRVEEWDEGAGRQDLVLARALAPQPVVLEYAAPLLREGGALLDWRGRRLPDEERAAREAAAQLGLERAEIRAVEPFAGARDRHLHLYVKVGHTPPRFPRRPGAALKRPLDGARRRGG